jgi:cell division protein FtsB
LQEKKIEAQIKDLNDVVCNQHKKSQEELLVIQNSQNFIGAKFDELLAAVNSLKEENNQLKAENVKLTH